MPTFNKIAFILAPALVLLGWLPSGAQNLGVRGGNASVRGSMPQRSAPQRSAPQRTAPQRTAPQRTAPQRSTTTQNSRSQTSTRPLVRQNIPQATRTSSAATSQSSDQVRGTSPRSYTPGNQTRVNGTSPRATYPGRIYNSAARTNTNAVTGQSHRSTQRNPVQVAPTNPTFSNSDRVTGYSPRGNRTRANNTTTVVNNGPTYANRPVYYNNNSNNNRI